MKIKELHKQKVVRLMGYAVALGLTVVPVAHAVPLVLPELAANLINNYDWEHPNGGNLAQELDQGSSNTTINLVNGGAAMRVNDGAYALSKTSIQTQQVGTTTALTASDDWRAGIYSGPPGVASLNAYAGAREITLMGWVKPDVGATNPSLNTRTSSPTDFWNAVGLFGILQGGTAAQNNGHNVRALLEIIDVGGTMRLVALARRTDSGAGSTSNTFAASEDWHTLVPAGEWTHLAATFNYDTGVMALYRNGVQLAGFYTAAPGADPWAINGGAEPDVTSLTNPGGIKIGGSFPQDTEDRNPFNGRFDDLMFFNSALTAAQVAAQYQLMATATAPVPSTAGLALLGLLALGGLSRRRQRAIEPR